MRPWTLVLMLLACSAGASADAPRVVDSARLRVGDVVSGTRDPVASVDLGPAPPPGGTRLLGRSEIQDAINKAGYDPSRLRIPSAVRVTGASRTIEPEQVAALCRPALQAALPQGVALLRVEPASRVVISPRSELRVGTLPPIPRQKGQARLSVNLAWATDQRVVASSHVTLIVNVSEAAATPDIKKGSALTLVVERNQVKVSAAGVSLADAMIGEEIRATVTNTHRVVKARLVARDRATVLE